MRWKGCSHTTHTPFPSQRTMTYLGGDFFKEMAVKSISLSAFTISLLQSADL